MSSKSWKVRAKMATKRRMEGIRRIKRGMDLKKRRRRTKRGSKMKTSLSWRTTSMKMTGIGWLQPWSSQTSLSTFWSISRPTVLIRQFTCRSSWSMPMGFLFSLSFWIRDLKNSSLSRVNSLIKSVLSCSSMKTMIWTQLSRRRCLSYWGWLTSSAEIRRRESSNIWCNTKAVWSWRNWLLNSRDWIFGKMRQKW